MSLVIGQLKLRDSFKDLRLRFARVKEEWSDAAARDFEAEVIEPIGPAVERAIEAAGRMQQLIGAAKRDSGGDSGQGGIGG